MTTLTLFGGRINELLSGLWTLEISLKKIHVHVIQHSIISRILNACNYMYIHYCHCNVRKLIKIVAHNNML